jgi:hypothetical protein
MEGNKYYKRLAKLPFWAFVALFALTFPLFIVEIILIRGSYIPRLLSPLQELKLPELVDRLNTGFDKILLNLCVTGLGFFIMVILLMYIVWNVRKFFQVLK